MHKTGYWNPVLFPNVSRFAALPREEQNRIIRTSKSNGIAEALRAMAQPASETEEKK